MQGWRGQVSTVRDPVNQDPAQLQPPEMAVGRVASGVEPRLPFRFGEYAPAVCGNAEVVGRNQLPASRTHTVVMDRRTVTEGDGAEQGAVP